ncbi:MAG: hypothetical protein SWK90_17695 [Chloroflexota bacterium]|nr:hypothetical protein [Chloroflexota bacterium]
MPSLLPILAITLPLLGAGVTIGLSLVPRARAYASHVALIVTGITAILALMLTRMEPVVVVLSLWQPSLLFGAALTLETDVIMQPLALVLALITCSAILVGLGRTEGPHPRLAATLLALLSAGLAALWAANLLTMIVVWAIYDLLHAAGCIAAGGSGRTAIHSLIFGCLATLVLWSGALLTISGMGSDLWSLMTLSDAPLTLWLVAGVLRLWVYPLHLSAPDDLDATQSLAAPLLLSPIVGWGLWLRLAQANGGSIPDSTWVPVIAAATLAIGGFLAWSCESPRRMLPWVGMGTSGAILLTAGLVGDNAITVIVAASAVWALGLTVLLLSDGLQREALWWNIPPLVGALALGGMFLMSGFVADTVVIGGLTQGDSLGWGISFFVGLLFLVPSLVRWLLLPPSSSFPRKKDDRGIGSIACGVGLGLPALLLIVVGLSPSLLSANVLGPLVSPLFVVPGLRGGLLLAAALAGGGVLAWQEGKLRPKIQLFLSAAHDLLRLEWFYDAVAGALERGLSILWAAGELVGGAGTLLWSCLLFLLLLLVWGGR